MADRPAHARERYVEHAPPIERPTRTGDSRIERLAAQRVRESVAAMPASLVVQLAMWPDELARWARAERIAESVVYNLLARRKPYLRIRERLAAHLGVPTGHLAMLVDGQPAAGGAPPEPPSRTGDGAPAWRRRTGTNPLERRAIDRVEREAAAMPAATVVGLALWPETLTEWARARGLQPSAVWATLAGTPSEQVATALARRLDVSVREVMALIEAERRPAGAGGSAPAAVAVTDAPAPQPVERELRTPTRGGPAPPTPPPEERGQLSLGL